MINVYIITNNLYGGSGKYLIDIVNRYKNYNNFIYINSEILLKNIIYLKNDIIFVGHIFGTTINVTDIIDIKIKYDCKLIIPIHDFYWLTYDLSVHNINIHNIYLKNNIQINSNIKKIFDIADTIIHPSKFTYDIYSKFLPNINFKIVNHNDYFIDYSTKYIPPIVNNEINIGMVSIFTECKGKHNIEILQNRYTIYNNHKIIFMINSVNIPMYNELEFYDYIKKYNLHCLVFLNKWGETWCYTLTKGINSGLPIIYNNFGSFKERIQKKEHYFKVYENENENENENEKLYIIFENMLDYIISNNGKFNTMNINTKIIYNRYYNKLFKDVLFIK
jgi:hypothetical protein